MSTANAAGTPGPIGVTDRIHAIDAARGFALLGILFVNIITFSQPFGTFIEPTPGDVPVTDKLAFYFSKIFCEGKFYPLFSMLFGAGLTMQMARSRAAGRRFWPIGLRRLGVLALIGLCHAFLLWYGDILFVYSVVGLLLLVAARARPRTLTILAAAFLFMATVLSTGFGLLTTLSAAPQSQSATAAEPGQATPANAAREAQIQTALNNGEPRPFERLIRSFEHRALFEDAQNRGISPMAHPVWLQAETEVYQRGPWLDALGFRAMTYAMILIFVFLGFGWSVIAMILFGAALAKWSALAPDRLDLHRRWAFLGLGIGLPLSGIAAVAPAAWGVSLSSVLVFIPLQILSGPLVALGYFGLISVLVNRGVASGFFGGLAAAGRTALTCYLLETVLATLVFYHYGLGLFGTLSRLQVAGVVLAIYAIVVAFSIAWTARFRYGPMEWLWRSLTYLKAQPMRRADSAPPA